MVGDLRERKKVFGPFPPLPNLAFEADGGVSHFFARK
jgi:hypothetical protein